MVASAAEMEVELRQLASDRASALANNTRLMKLQEAEIADLKAKLAEGERAVADLSRGFQESGDRISDLENRLRVAETEGGQALAAKAAAEETARKVKVEAEEAAQKMATELEEVKKALAEERARVISDHASVLKEVEGY